MGTIYTIGKEGSEENEFDRFRLDTANIQYLSDMNDILLTIKYMGETEGYYCATLRYEAGKYIYAFPPRDEIGSLRLYCIVYEPGIIILFSGGAKTAATWQEDSNLRPVVEELIEIERRIESALHLGRIVLDQNQRGFTDPNTKRKHLLKDISF